MILDDQRKIQVQELADILCKELFHVSEEQKKYREQSKTSAGLFVDTGGQILYCWQQYLQEKFEETKAVLAVLGC